MRVKRILFFSFLSIALSLIVIFALAVIIYDPQEPVKINAGSLRTSINKKEVAKLLSSSLARGDSRLILGFQVPIEVTKESLVKKTPFTFNAVAPSWKVDLTQGAQIIFQVRASKDGNQWTDWKNIEEDEDGDAKDNQKSSQTWGRLVVLEGQYIQNRVIIRTSNLEQTPQISELKLTYLDSTEKINLLEKFLETIKMQVKDVLASSHLPTRPTDSPSICSRACWKADESIYVPGEDYSPVKKMVVHHTVTSNDDSNPAATVRAIYYFHNVIRGWGDIGYNFLVDQKSGKIYEGRYGGDGVIGAHARGYNAGSVGVGVLGDFRFVKPNKKVINAIHKIAVWKLYSHKIDPDVVSNFGSPKRKLPSVFYHGQVANTACAGTNLNNFVPSVKKLAHYMPQQIVLRKSSGTQRIGGGSDKTVFDLLVAYKSQGVVAPNYIRKISIFPTDGTTPPDDQNYSNQWDLVKLDALNVWKETNGGDSSIKVAVVDTGVAYEDYNPAGSENYAKGPDFADVNFVPGFDYINNDTHPNDDHGHGTVVTSVLSESTDNSLGSAALAYNISIMPVKVCDKDGWCVDGDIAKGIDFARNNGTKVINLAIVGDDYSSVIQATIDAAWDTGIALVAATGNDGKKRVSFPAYGNHVVGVGALTSSDTRASYSNYGSGLDLSAPGGDGGPSDNGDLIYQILTCTANLDCTNFSYSRVSGTSLSTALVSASLALVINKGTELPDLAARYLMIKALDLGSAGKDGVYGWGRVRPYNSLQIVSSEKPHPNGSLVRAKGGTAIYLIDNGKKRKIPSPSIFLSRFNPKLIASVSSYEVGSYPNGSAVTFNDGVLLKGSSTALYVLADGKKRWIRSPKAFSNLSYKSENIIKVSDATIAGYPNGPDLHSSTTHPNGSLIRARGKTSVYLIDNGQKRKIPSPSVLISRFNKKYILEAGDVEVGSYPIGSNVVHGDASLLRAVGGTTIFVLSDEQKRRISHPMTFSDLGYRSENITEVSSFYLDSFTNGDSVI